MSTHNICLTPLSCLGRKTSTQINKQHMFSSRNKKDISIFGDKKSALSVAMFTYVLMQV